MENTEVQPNLVVNRNVGFFGIKVVDPAGNEIPDEAPSGPYGQKKPEFSNFSFFGICLDQNCRDQQSADIALQRAQAEALSHLNNPTSTSQFNPGKIMLYGVGAAVLLLTAIITAQHFSKK